MVCDLFLNHFPLILWYSWAVIYAMAIMNSSAMLIYAMALVSTVSGDVVVRPWLQTASQSTIVLLHQAARHLVRSYTIAPSPLLSGYSTLFDFAVRFLCFPNQVSRLLVVGGCDFSVKKNMYGMDDCVVAVYPCMFELI
jgi:hypothetical protein